MEAKAYPRSVEIWPIEKPIINSDNARVHPDDQIETLVSSLRRFGWTRPILVDETGTVLGGQGILVAAQRLGLETVPVVISSHLSGTEKRAYVIADNQLAATSSWDEEKLSRELERLEKEQFPLLDLGFSPQELDRLLWDLAPECSPVDEDQIPEELPSAVTSPGDVWMLQSHRVLCGDATSGENLSYVLEGGFADLIFTDPPYNVAYERKGRRSQRSDVQIANDDLGPEFAEFLTAACGQMLAVSRGAIYICMSSSELHTLHTAFAVSGGHRSDVLIWDKGKFTLGRADFQHQYEPILYGWKEGGTHFWCQARNEGDVWYVPKPQANPLHPTTKPVALIERAIRNSSRRGDLVLDPFGGSGSTLIACEKTGRRARMVKLIPYNVDVIVRRWERYTGKVAYQETDGRSFTELLQGLQPVEA